LNGNNAPLITVGSGVTLTNITFKGLKSGQTGDNGNNTAPLIKVNGGTLVLGTGAYIQDNTNTGNSTHYGGVIWRAGP
jgi:hypothetical protein